MAVDTVNELIYWTDVGTNEVIRVDYTGEHRHTIISNIPSAKGIALFSGGDLAIIQQNKILRYDTSGQMVGTLVENLSSPNDLYIHNDKIYWSNNGTNTIESVNLDGTGRSVILQQTFSVSDIEVNAVDNRIYWVQHTGGIPGSGIFSADLTGQDRDTIIEDFCGGISIDGQRGWLYWSDITFLRIMRTNLNNPTETFSHISSLVTPRGIAYHRSINKLFFLNKAFADFLFSANLNSGGSVKAIAASAVYYPTRFEVDSANQMLYWVNSKSAFVDDKSVSIVRAKFDGSQFEVLLRNPELGSPFGLALDLDNNKMYWTDRAKDAIGSSNLDGSNIVYIVNGLQTPVGISLDQVNGKLYWADWGSSKIQRANTDGSSVEDVISSGLSTPYDVTFRHADGKLYWVDYGNSTINRANIDGTEVENIITTKSSARKPNGFYLDEGSQKIYYTIDFSGEKIQRADFDGANVENVITQDIFSPHDVTLINSALILSYNSPSDKPILLIYPNPTSGDFTIESSVPIQSIAIYDQLGQVMLHNACQDQPLTCTINMAQSIQGIYWAVVTLTNGQYKSLPVLFQR